jgi:hypothetical protein
MTRGRNDANSSRTGAAGQEKSATSHGRSAARGNQGPKARIRSRGRVSDRGVPLETRALTLVPPLQLAVVGTNNATTRLRD